MKAEVCRGQEPPGIDEATYMSWPPSAKQYATSNVDQWLKGCSETT